MYQYSNSLIRQFPSLVTGNAAVGVQATVYIGETGATALLFESNGTTPKPNPVTTDSKGFYSFSVADGDYRIVFSSSQFATLRISVLGGAQIREDFDDLVASNTAFRNEQQAAYDAFVLSRGWTQVGTFSAGFTFTSPNQVGQDTDGNWWRWNGTLPKVVTAGTLPSSDANYKLVGDGVLRGDLASPRSEVLVGGVEAGDLAFRYTSELLGEYVELMDWLPKDIAQRAYDGDVTLDMKPYIDTALTLYKHIGLPAFTIYSTGEHDITERRVSGKSPEFSILKLMGTNTAGVMFRNGITSTIGLGTWGAGLDWSIKNLWIQGNWDGVTGLTSVIVERVNGETGSSSGPYSTNIGVLQADYNFETNKALIKSINSVRNNLENCRVSLSYEHGVMVYRGGYSLWFDNLIFSNRGTGTWLTADNPENGVTSYNLIANKIEGNRGWFGNLRWKYYYGCSIHGNLAEAGNYGLYFEEGAEMDVTGGYSEAATTADVYIDPAAWNINFINHAWFTPPPIPATRGHFIYSKQSGLKYQPSIGVKNNFAGMTFTDDGKFGINTERRIRQFNVRSSLVAPGQPAFSQYAGIRISGSATDTDDAATTEVLTEANVSDSSKSRLVFGVNNGAGMQYRARVTEEGHFHTDGSWNGSHFVWGNNHVWIDSAGAMRIKGSAPTSDTDGVVVGSQV